MKNRLIVYTDGSCNPEYGMGAWASILFIDENKIVLSGKEEQTTHQRMELQAVIKSFEYLAKANLQSESMELYTDRQVLVSCKT